MSHLAIRRLVEWTYSGRIIRALDDYHLVGNLSIDLLLSDVLSYHPLSLHLILSAAGAEKALESAAAHGWSIDNMQRDWRTIFTTQQYEQDDHRWRVRQT